MQLTTEEYKNSALLHETNEVAAGYEKNAKIDNMSWDEIYAMIEEFSELKANWDGYGAIPIGWDVINKAHLIVVTLSLSTTKKYFQNFYDGYPNTHGTISLEWINQKGEEFFIEIGKKTTSYYIKLNNQEIIKRENEYLNDNQIKTIQYYIEKLNASI